MDEARAVVERDRPAGHHPPGVHPRRSRHRHRLDAGGVRDPSPRNGLDASPISEILIEKSIAGWKEYELEVMRDRADNCVIICSIENVDPMGVHTGDSITVAPAQTLSDVEYQQMRDAAFACIRRVGVETGGSNVQFAVNPATGEQVVIEMNPRVSRSSALASKATGFPIAKIAAKLAVGYTLDEIANDITPRQATPASFEPSIDYVVTKIPRWAFEKLPGTKGVLGTQMQSVGEAMSHRAHVHREPAEGPALAGAGPPRPRLRPGRGAAGRRRSTTSCWPMVAIPTPERIFQVGELLRRGVAIDDDPRGVPDRPVVPRPDAADRRGARRARPTSSLDEMTRRVSGGGPSSSASATPSSRYLWGADELVVRAAARGGRVSSRRTRPSTRAPPSSPPRRRTTTAPRRTRTRSAQSIGRGSSSSAAGRTASARASSSTTAACTPRSRCATPASRR